MFLRFTLLLLCLAIPSTVLGQVRIIQGPNGPQVVPQQTSWNRTHPLPNQTYLGPAPVRPNQTYLGPAPVRPNPVPQQGIQHHRIPGGWVSNNTATGVNNQTGGIDTSNSQIADSAFANGREQGKANRRWVSQPVYGANGQITGYQEGYVWNNSITGQQHHDLKVRTPNGSNGVHTQSWAVQQKVGPNYQYNGP